MSRKLESYEIEFSTVKGRRCKLYAVYTDGTEKCLGWFKNSNDAERKMSIDYHEKWSPKGNMLPSY